MEIKSPCCLSVSTIPLSPIDERGRYLPRSTAADINRGPRSGDAVYMLSAFVRTSSEASLLLVSATSTGRHSDNLRQEPFPGSDDSRTNVECRASPNPSSSPFINGIARQSAKPSTFSSPWPKRKNYEMLPLCLLVALENHCIRMLFSLYDICLVTCASKD